MSQLDRWLVYVNVQGISSRSHGGEIEVKFISTDQEEES